MRGMEEVCYTCIATFGLGFECVCMMMMTMMLLQAETHCREQNSVPAYFFCNEKVAQMHKIAAIVPFHAQASHWIQRPRTFMLHWSTGLY